MTNEDIKKAVKPYCDFTAKGWINQGYFDSLQELMVILRVNHGGGIVSGTGMMIDYDAANRRVTVLTALHTFDIDRADDLSVIAGHLEDYFEKTKLVYRIYDEPTGPLGAVGKPRLVREKELKLDAAVVNYLLADDGHVDCIRLIVQLPGGQVPSTNAQRKLDSIRLQKKDDIINHCAGDDSKQCQFLHLGLSRAVGGDVFDVSLDNFKHRFLTFNLSQEYVMVVEKNKLPYGLIESTAANTGIEGDSGGPILMRDEKGKYIILGCYCGSELDSSEHPEQKSGLGWSEELVAAIKDYAQDGASPDGAINNYYHHLLSE